MVRKKSHNLIFWPFWRLSYPSDVGLAYPISDVFHTRAPKGPPLPRGKWAGGCKFLKFFFRRASTILLSRPAASGSRGNIPERLKQATRISRTLQKPKFSEKTQYLATVSEPVAANSLRKFFGGVAKSGFSCFFAMWRVPVPHSLEKSPLGAF